MVDVDYAGSTGYGRAYRRLLDGAWGIADVEDCLAAASAISRPRGGRPGAAVAIRGGSAGGYTTLCALAFHDLFRAGASWYGHRRSRGAGARHPQIREPLSRPAGRPLAGGGSPTGRARRSTMSTG
ncbi:MAG: prolyl oligopeptidase family serine peptidase [Geminicoccaceae bacterium]